MQTHRYRRARPFTLFLVLGLALPSIAMLPAIALEKSASTGVQQAAGFVPIPLEHADIAVGAKPKPKAARAHVKPRPQKKVKDRRTTSARRLGLSWPVAKAAITSPFGWRPFYVWPGMKGPHPKLQFHHGTDISCALNQPVVASKAGRVILSGTDVDYGNVIVIQHSGGWSTLYAHLNKRLVPTGRIVAARARIGLCGMTGHASGVHLHFEVRHLGSFYDPLKYLP
jgi:murein DD-endopeptidase MepM/ murein hydrolase activator NlpD